VGWIADTDGLRRRSEPLAAAERADILDALAAVVAQAPFFTPTMPRSGRPFSVRMTNAGVLGWVSDRAGYRYQAHHPQTGAPWPAIPGAILAVWRQAVPGAPEPEACLVNLYRPGARMGLHVDADEAAGTVPVVSVSLGAPATFRLGGAGRGDATRSMVLRDGDVLVLDGAARRAHHGIDRVHPVAFGPLAPVHPLLEGGARINLTLRRVTVPPAPEPLP
jgi:alkylated DNA repair protein (DNA oxidative demethylase)